MRRWWIAATAAALALAVPHEGRSDEKAGTAKAAGTKPKGKKPAPLPPLDGTTYDFSYDGKDVGHAERAWLGRAFVHKKAAADANKALPLLVFVHGLNSELIKYRWMGGGNEGDVRRIVSELVEGGQLPPMLVAAPSSVVPRNIGVATTSWMAFDLDHFVEKTAAALKGHATIDKTKIIVAGHSGGGCNVKGGIATAIKAKNVHAALVIDTCMGADLASALAQAKKSVHVAVTWQAITWGKRPFKDFRAVFEREVKKAPADEGVLRTLDLMTPKEPMPHDAMVSLTLKKYLPLLLPPPKAAAASAAKVGP
jgi:pimeloyl-ACP methyl ester carboxylesterase